MKAVLFLLLMRMRNPTVMDEEESEPLCAHLNSQRAPHFRSALDLVLERKMINPLSRRPDSLGLSDVHDEEEG